MNKSNVNKPNQRRFQGVESFTAKASLPVVNPMPQTIPIKFIPGVTPLVYANTFTASFSQSDVTLTFGQIGTGPDEESIAGVRLVIPHQLVGQMIFQLDFLSLTLRELYGGSIPMFNVSETGDLAAVVARVQETMTKRLQEAAQQAAQAASSSASAQGASAPIPDAVPAPPSSAGE